MKIRPKWVLTAALVGLVVALFLFGYGLAALLVTVLAGSWPVSERWSREYAHRLDPDATEPEPGSPFEQHLP